MGGRRFPARPNCIVDGSARERAQWARPASASSLSVAVAGVVGVVEALGARAVDKPQHGDRQRSFEGRGAREGREFTRPPIERVVSYGRDGRDQEM